MMLCVPDSQPLVDCHAAVAAVVAELDPVMVPLGFAAGQAGFGDDSAQVIYCEPHRAGDGLCADVMIDLKDSSVGWRIAGVDYDGFAVDEVAPLRLDRDATLVEQLALLRKTIGDDLGRTSSIR
ncbi:MAG: hypothetical protein KDB37_02580 [Ilumatobacter sp.]|nr:hypothetical protein [Ilumatobacter sp.]